MIISSCGRSCSIGLKPVTGENTLIQRYLQFENLILIKAFIKDKSRDILILLMRIKD